jgi:hypothetical protein
MYVQDSEIECDALRQGDIISQIHLLGAIKLGAITQLSNQKGEKIGWQIPGQLKTGDAIVLSDSCEIDQINKIKITSVILCPIRDVNSATENGKISELIESNIIKSDSKTSYLKYFYLTPNVKLAHKNGAIADFSKLFSFHKDSFEFLLQHKILQLKPEIVDSFSLKLALYFHRCHAQS